MKIVVVILIGGPSLGTRFRPLSMEIPKPLFPLAGKPLLWYHLSACSSIEGLEEVILIGFEDLESNGWKDFLENSEKEFGFGIKYIKEESRLGTAGGFRHYQAQILHTKPDHFFVLHSDICCSFPLVQMLDFHLQHGKTCTILGKKVPKNEACQYGVLGIADGGQEALHYVEKPTSYVNDVINAGIYLFHTSSIYSAIQQVISQKSHRVPLGCHPDFLRLEQDILPNICAGGHVFVFESEDFWLQIKNPGNAVECERLLLEKIEKEEPHLLAPVTSDVSRSTPVSLSEIQLTGPKIIGRVMIHPLATVHASATLGPNVTISQGVVIGPGARIRDSIVLANTQISDHAVILYTILGWNSKVGQWARVEGFPLSNESPDPASHLPSLMCIIGDHVTIHPEVYIRSCTVLPHKSLSSSTANEIVL